jgi:hypothetical protein
MDEALEQWLAYRQEVAQACGLEKQVDPSS